MSSKPTNKAGFTLLEVLISVALLGVISLGIYQATTETYRLREVLMNEGDFYNGIRLALGVMDRDVAMLYTPAIMNPKPKTAGKPPDQQDLTVAAENQTSTFWVQATDKSGIRQSHFIGTDTKLSFVAASHLRIYKDAPESDFAEVSYELQAAKDPLLPETYVLVKAESPNAFNDDEKQDKMRHTYVLLHGIKKWKYRYYNKEKDRWETSWDSDKEEYKDIYPDIIEVKLEVMGPSRLNFEGLYKFRPEIPLHGINSST